MRARRGGALLGLALGLTATVAGCIGTTGGELVTFRAAAAGVPGVAPGMRFATPEGYEVRLDRARLQVGSVYLNLSRPQSGGRETSCILPGIYVGQVTTGLVVDALSSSLQMFPEAGQGTTERALTGEVWFGVGDINANVDDTVVLDAAGEAQRGGAVYPFEARFTISAQRKKPPQSPALPGSNPLCQERIVTPIQVDLRLAAGGMLVLRVDPKAWFASVQFDGLTADDRGVYVFRDEGVGQPNIALYDGIRRVAGVYSFSWEPDPG